MNETQTRLTPEDQAKVNEFLSHGINATERSRFKPLKLMLWLTAIIIFLGVLSRILGTLILG